MKVRNINLMIVLLLVGSISLCAQTITVLPQKITSSIRGLSVVNDKTAWVSGSKGSVAISNDGGNSWDWQQIKGYEKADFRDIEAFSDKEAVIISSGTPALILKTTDGGKTWQEKYRNADSIYFLDAMDFENKKHGYVLGDPIKGKFLMIETTDEGETWHVMNNAPEALNNEAAFAASGTCLRLINGKIMVVTGGSNSRVLTSPIQRANTWQSQSLPLTNGAASRGAFSFAAGKSELIVVGGDYTKNQVADSVAYVITNNGNTNNGQLIKSGPAGYQSCVEYLDAQTYLSTGTPGSNITIDGGATWNKIDSTSFNVCRKAKRGNLVLLAGDNGKIGIFNP